MDRMIVDLASGVSFTQPLTPGEQAEYDARQLAEAEARTAEATRLANRRTLRTTVTTDLTPLVGKTWRPVSGRTQLTTAEKQNLVLGVLFRLGVIDRDTAVLPLDQWLGD